MVIDMIFKNVIARFNPDADFQTIISCHWDTRPWAEHEEKRKDRVRQFWVQMMVPLELRYY